MSFVAYIQTVYTSVSSFVTYLYTLVITVIDINFKAVSVIIETCKEIITTIVHVLSVAHNLLSNVFTSAFDFLLEIIGLLHALVLVIWKFIVFLGSVCYSAYQCIEILIYFIIHHAIWLFRLLTGGASNCKETLVGVYEFTSYYSVFLVKQVIAGIGVIGTYGFDTIATFFIWIKWLLTSFWTNIDNSMMAFAESVKYLTDMLYYGVIDLMYLKRETYIGFLICILVFLFVGNVFKTLKQRGMTFPSIHDNLDVRYTRVRANFGFDFSDNEEEESDENYEVESDDSDVTIASSEADDDEEDVDEYEIDDATTDEDELSDSDSIDIQLPTVNAHNVRRSTTPSRLNVHSPEDFQKEIEKEKEKTKCVVCQDHDKSVLILPCKHLCLCLQCGNTIARSRNVERRVCPLCRKKIETIMNVYT